MSERIEFVKTSGLVIPVLGAAAGVFVTVKEALEDGLMNKFDLFVTGWATDHAVWQLDEYGVAVVASGHSANVMQLSADFRLVAFLKG